MHKKQLQQALHHLRGARNGADWKGKFTPAIREATVTHRAEYIAKPIDIAIRIIETELGRCDRKIAKRRERKTRQVDPAQYRAPYKDD